MLTKNQITKFREKIYQDPIWMMENLLKRNLWQKEKEICLSVRDNSETAVRSCNASGKTYTAGGIVHWWLLSYDDAIVVTTAPTGRQVREVLWREIRSACANKSLYPLNSVLETQINLDNKWFAIGLSTDTPDQFQGFHSPHLLVIVDEASGIAPVIWEAIDGLKPERILSLGNPLSNTGRFADDFKQQNVNKIHISAFDTPNVQAGKIIIPGLIGPEDVNKIRQRYGEDSDVYRVRILGEFPRADSDSLFGIDEISSAIEREVKVNQSFEKKMGVDVARYGDDRTVILVRQMEQVIRKEAFSQSDLMQTVGRVINIAKEERIKPENIYVDVIGIGAGVVDRIKEEGWNIRGVNVAESPSTEGEEHYANLRAELFNKVKEWIKTGKLPKDDDFYELANIKYKFNSKGQMLIESKEDMKKRGLESPDTADALALTFTSNLIRTFGEASQSLNPYYPEIGL